MGLRIDIAAHTAAGTGTDTRTRMCVCLGRLLSHVRSGSRLPKERHASQHVVDPQHLRDPEPDNAELGSLQSALLGRHVQ